MFTDFSHIPKRPGVYRITNTVTGDSYIGASAWSCRNRVINHFSQLRCGTHKSKAFIESFRTHGEQSFKAEMVERCGEARTTEREAYWIRLLQPAFNTQLKRERMRPLIIPVSRRMKRRIRAAAKAKGVTMAQWCREALERGVEMEEMAQAVSA